MLAEATPVLVHNCGTELQAHAESVQKTLGDDETRVATIMRLRDGTVYKDRSGPRDVWDLEPDLSEAMLDHRGPDGMHHGGCGEIGCINQALEDGRSMEDLSGARFESATIRGRRGAITPVAPCDDYCRPLLDGLGMSG